MHSRCERARAVVFATHRQPPCASLRTRRSRQRRTRVGRPPSASRPSSRTSGAAPPPRKDRADSTGSLRSDHESGSGAAAANPAAAAAALAPRAKELSDFEVLGRLGEGGFGKVMLVRDRETGLLLAMKCLSKRRIVTSGYIQQVGRRCGGSRAFNPHIRRGPWRHG